MHVFITDEARHELGEIWDFIAQRSVESADRLAEALIAKAIAIGERPYAARVMPGRGSTRTRRVNFRSWAILYEVIDERVEILSFVQGKNDPRRMDPHRR